MKQYGSVHTLRVSGRYLLALALFLIVFVVFSIVFINRFLPLWWELEDLREENVRLSRLVRDHRIRSQLTSQYKQLMEALNHEEPNGEAAGTDQPVESARVELAAEEAVGESQQETGQNGPEPLIPEPTLDVSKLVFKPDRGARSLEFSFHLRKVDPHKELVSGYLIALFEDSADAPEKSAAYPSTIQFVQGEPDNYRKGLRFAIRYGRPIKGRLKNLSEPEGYDHVTVLAYSDTGELLMKQTIRPAGQ